ncbi:MAG: 4-(cytidine 5'-diphospho)-2-C-methyl-D-erythritol kinase [Candidatus Gastranaerophilales bacterium]|nr:4-(cytidine 5'-diphospho)-2-C-methyl-D-erythritol kinase [Candidatus Gastranaerophilales bacterium]
MEKIIKVECPAKINLDLRVFPRDNSGFHPIKSIMQTISLFDYLTIKLSEGDEILLSGTSDEIPYNEKNLCYKAVKLFLENINKKFKVEIFIEKNIPVEAGLAGGSTDGAGVLFGLNNLLDNIIKKEDIQTMASKLGSDLNFCLLGGTKLCQGKGDDIKDMPFYDFKLSLVKPKNLKISTKDAYMAFDTLDRESNMRNDLEFALLDKYEELQFLNSMGMQMSGSGPTFFLRDKNIDFEIDENKYLVINNLNSVNHGVREV